VLQVDDANIAWRKAGIAYSVRRLLTDMLKHVCQVSPHMPDLPVSDTILDTVVVLMDNTTQQQVSNVGASFFGGNTVTRRHSRDRTMALPTGIEPGDTLMWGYHVRLVSQCDLRRVFDVYSDACDDRHWYPMSLVGSLRDVQANPEPCNSNSIMLAGDKISVLHACPVDHNTICDAGHPRTVWACMYDGAFRCLLEVGQLRPDLCVQPKCISPWYMSPRLASLPPAGC
jgi:hypothetical protein